MTCNGLTTTGISGDVKVYEPDGYASTQYLHGNINSSTPQILWQTNPDGQLYLYSWIGWGWYIMGHFDKTSGGYYATSDATLKNNINNLNQAHSLERILNITPRSYKFNGNDKDIFIGIIAQEISPNMPNALSETPISGLKDQPTTSHYQVNYNDIFIHNVNATKELHKIIQEQATIISNQEIRILNIETQLSNNFDFSIADTTIVNPIIPIVISDIIQDKNIAIDTVTTTQYNDVINRMEILEQQIIDLNKLLVKIKKELKK
jgi:hypothetical protein